MRGLLKKKNFVCILLLVLLCLSIVTVLLPTVAENQEEENNLVRAETLFEGNEQIKSVKGNVDVIEPFGTGNGVEVVATLTGSRLRYKNVLDLNGMKNDTNLIEFQVYYDGGQNYCEISELNIRLIDKYNPENVLTINFHYVVLIEDINWYQVLMKAGTKGDLYGEKGAAKNAGGTHLEHSFYGRSTNFFRIQLDYDERQVWGDSPCFNRYGEKVLVIDLDDKEQVGSQNVWNGFTTGEVYLEIAYPMLSGNGTIVITEVAGQKIKGEYVDDKTAPAIHLSTDEVYGDELPDGIKGKSYRLPEIIANDIVYGESDYDVQIFSASEYEKEVEVSNGKEFVPPESGEYIMRVTSRDGAGNVAVREEIIRVYESLEDITVSLSHDCKPYAGEYFKLPELIIDGGSGQLDVEQTVTLNDIHAEILSDGSVFIDETGELKIEYRIEDYLGQSKEGEFIFEVGCRAVPFISVKGMPEYILKDTMLSIPQFIAIDYLHSEEDIQKSVYINGVKLESDEYAVQESDKTLEIEFVATCSHGQSVVTKTVQVLPKGSLKDLFLTENVKSVSLSENGALFDVNGRGVIRLPFALSAQSLSFGLTFDTDVAYVDVKLTDVYNERKSVLFRIFASDGEDGKASLNAKGELLTINPSVTTTVCNYRDDTMSFYREDGRLITSVDKYLNGEPFEGFEKDTVYMEIITADVNAQLEINNISNQPFNVNAELSGKGPVIAYAESVMRGRVKKGMEIVLPAATGYDVTDGISPVRVSVQDENGEYILKNKHANREYYFNIDKYGIFTITYSSEASGFKTVEEYNIICKDTVPPQIVIDEPYNVEYSKGKKIEVLGAQVSDNVDAEVELLIFFVDAKGFYRKVSVGEKIDLNDTGLQYFVYYACDAEYNVNVTRYEFIVR